MMLDPTNPVAVLRALTLEAHAALHGHELKVAQFPFRIGRESRGPNAGWKREGIPERRTEGNAPSNDLYLWEPGPDRYVSREHCAILYEDDAFYLLDRSSALGTWVEGQLVGGNRQGGRTALHHGDVIILASARSGFIFKFLIDGE